MANAAASNQYGQLASLLTRIGLGALFEIDSQGNPGGWLWDQIQAGVDTESEIMMAIESTDVFRARFGVIQEQQKRAAAGEPIYVMSPADVLQYEDTVRKQMAAAGLPSTFYDQPQDFHKLILADMSPTEVQQRITQAYDYVLSAPPEVRSAFNDFYGVGNGDAQLAAWALDSERTVRDITKATRTAYSAGMAERFDVKIDRATAERIADLPTTEAGIVEGMRQVASMTDVYTRGIGETGDITTTDGVDAVFDGSSEAAKKISRRIGERKAIDRSSTGGAIVTREGVVGAASA